MSAESWSNSLTNAEGASQGTKNRNCDPACYELVKSFLEEEGITAHQAIFEIACDVQDAIEDGIATAKRERAEASGEDVEAEEKK